ncbi:hypothetical protein NQ318_023121 [Aromia moschata]|uniref:Uncharacterized protein n=1 Tax=Aromia moschata TaxID=1265417 RepID=A0AAV8Y5A9_9CUCU|nr:hypothetical protein NQ318_023121 [Aromia moschata]
MTSPGAAPGGIGRRQKRMGPAPFASFEDLSDEVRSRRQDIIVTMSKFRTEIGPSVNQGCCRPPGEPGTTKLTTYSMISNLNENRPGSGTRFYVLESRYEFEGKLRGMGLETRVPGPPVANNAEIKGVHLIEKEFTLESPEDKNLAGSVVRLPGIREDLTPTTPSIAERAPSPAFVGISLVGAINTYPSPTVPVMSSLPFQLKPSIKPANTPRIDISRASSSSHHDSRDSSPEREIFDARDPNSAKLGLGFKEDGALDLRSSTEELDFQDLHERKRCKPRPQSPSVHEDSAQIRKDSQCSDIILLSISGRTSRLSSIGSQGSNQSRQSNASHLSVMSGQSGVSRCSSPHKMVLETSFCGSKPPELAKANVEQLGTKVEPEDMEKVLLARKHDPTEAILAEGISVEPPEQKSSKAPPEKPVRKSEPRVECCSKSDITIKVDKPVSESNNTGKIPSRFVSDSGVEYFYIPLKGPLPADVGPPKTATSSTKQKLREVKSANFHSKSPTTKQSVGETKPRSKSATPSPIARKKMEEPKYIRIRLKPDGCYDDEAGKPQEIRKPDSLELDRIQSGELKSDKRDIRKECAPLPKQEAAMTASLTPNGSPKLPRDSGIADSNIESITPSPSVSRRSSFASLFKSKEAILSPESPSVSGHKRKNTLTGILREAGDNLRTRSRSRSKSRDRDSHKSSLSTAPSSTESIDSKSKHKSVLSLFKSKKDKIKSESENSSQETLPSIEGIGKRQPAFAYRCTPPPITRTEASAKTGRPPARTLRETVIEASSRNVSVTVEPIPKKDEVLVIKNNVITKNTSRQSSTSSENIVFSTKLGNDNEVFTTKLPKKLPEVKTVKEEVKIVKEEVKTIEMNGIDESIDVKEDIDSLKEKEELKIDIVEEKIVNETPQKKPSTPKHPAITKEHECRKLDGDVLREKRISQISTGALSSVSSLVSSNAEEDRNSSESERDLEEFTRYRRDRDLKLDLDVSEPERKAIFLQQDSFEDELPYIPTTLPQERSAAVPIVPVKQRSTFEIKTYPIDRPRSTTPINPSCLDEYCEEVMGTFNVESVTKTIEKLKISLPRNESFDAKTSKVKSPRKKESNTNWQEFAEKGISRATPMQASETPPPLPPKGLQKAWINFEDIPEKRKAPKRIQTIPSRSYIEVPEGVLQESVVYNYVNPDECKCECHEINAKERERRNKEAHVPVQEDELPLLEDDINEEEKNGPDSSDRIRLDVAVSDCRSIISDSSVDLSTSIDPQDVSGADVSLKTPFTSDLGVSSNRSSIVSQSRQRDASNTDAGNQQLSTSIL